MNAIDLNTAGPDKSQVSPDTGAETGGSLGATLDVQPFSLDGLDVLSLGNVSESTGAHASENQSDTGGKAAQSLNQDDEENAAQTVQLTVREQLLATAPAPEIMKTQIIQTLEAQKQKSKLAVKKYSKTRNYFKMSEAVKHLRQIAMQIQSISKASFEVLQNMWLKIVHQFSEA